MFPICPQYVPVEGTSYIRIAFHSMGMVFQNTIPIKGMGGWKFCPNMCMGFHNSVHTKDKYSGVNILPKALSI